MIQNTEDIRVMLRSGLSVCQVAEIKSISIASVRRIAKLDGHKFLCKKFDWEEGNDLIREGQSDETVARVVGCSVKTAQAHRYKQFGATRRYHCPDPPFHYGAWLEAKLRELHKGFCRHIPWTWSRWRKWIKTRHGQTYIQLALDSEERYTAQKDADRYQTGHGRVGRLSASL